MPEILIAPGITIDALQAPWSARDRAAWYWPGKIRPSEWIEKYITLQKTQIPGPFRFYNSPYLRGIANATAIRGVARVVVRKVVQAGVSELCRALMCYWAHTDPGPTGLTLPNEKKGNEIIENDVIPTLRSTFGDQAVELHPELSGILSKRPHDMKRGSIKLANQFLMYLMWSGSPASMASNPMTRALSDEADKFERWAGNDGDPVSLVEGRLTTAPEPLHMIISTPTNERGEITVCFKACGCHLYFLSPCPHCGARQRFVFGSGEGFGVKWNDTVRELQKNHRFTEAAAAVMDEGACWYECHECHGRISERQKRLAVRDGKWGTVGADLIMPGGVIDDIEAIDHLPAGSWVGMQVDSELLMWRTMAQQAADFLRARTYQQKFFFRTSRQGLPWEEIARDSISIAEASVSGDMPEGKLPWWTARLIAVIDSQKDHFWVVIRAWGPEMRSQRIWHNKVMTFADLDRICFGTPFGNEDARLPSRICDIALIDSGGGRSEAAQELGAGPAPSRVMEVYRWCLANQSRVRAIKGDARPKAGVYIRRGQGVYADDDQTATLPIWLLDVHHFQDYLVDLMGQKVKTPGDDDVGKPLWRLNGRDDPEYARHMENMHKVRRGVGDDTVWRWEAIREGLRVDYRAIEGYQVAAAEMMEVPVLPNLSAWRKFINDQLEQQSRPARKPESSYQTPDGRSYLATER